MTVQTHGAQCTSDSNVALSVPPSPAPSSTASHSSEGESDISDMMQPDTKKTKYVCRFDVVVILLKVQLIIVINTKLMDVGGNDVEITVGR